MGGVIDIEEAKTDVFRIVDEVAAGKEVIITKAGQPMARLSPIAHASPEEAWIAEGQATGSR